MIVNEWNTLQHLLRIQNLVSFSAFATVLHTSLAFMLNFQFYLNLNHALLPSKASRLQHDRYRGDKHGYRTLVSCDLLQ